MEAEKENNKFPNQHDTSQNVQEEQKKYAEESEKRVQRLRQLLEAAEAERRDLAAKLDEEHRKVEELEFRIEEECIGKDDLEAEREKERQKIEELERRLEQEVRKNEMISRGATPDSILKDEAKRHNDEIKSLQEKLRQSEAKIKDLQTIKLPQPQTTPVRADELMKKEEALLQAQLSLDNKKREVQNLLNRMSELEKELEKCKTRQTRQLDTIDDLNVKLQKCESKCVNIEEELHSSQEKTAEVERRLKASSEQVDVLQAEKKRLEEQLISPECTPQEQALLARLQDREKEVAEWRRETEAARKESDTLREDRERVKRDLEGKMRVLNEEHREECRREKKKALESEEANSLKIRNLDRSLSQVRSELESARVESEARLTRQEARLQEAELKTENLDRLREQISRLQAEKDLLRVEKEETWKRLQISEQSKSRWESEATRASEEVTLLRGQVQHLRTEFTSYREDLVKKLAETKFDAEVVQDLHLQIEEQRRLVEEMQHRLKYTEGERDQLQTTLSTRRQNHEQVENGLKQEMETLRRRLSESDAEKQSIRRSLEAAQLLIEERNASQKLQAQNCEKFQGEKSSLENRIIDLQIEVASLKNGKAEPDQSYAELKSEKDALEQQVNFMNSVIVDMQHKNDDLRSRLDILETEVIFDGHLQLGIPQHRSTARLFCDICDIFDVHDTEDCPKQRSVRRTLSYSSQESEF